jgi:hypothetical protein
VGEDGPTEEHYDVEARHWQAAFQGAREVLGDSTPLRRCSLELTDDGYCVVDPALGTRYDVRRAPPEEPLGESAPPETETVASPEDRTSSPPPPAESDVPTAPGAPDPLAQVLYQRPEVARPDSPIAYREVAYLVAPGTARETAEALLRTSLPAVTAELGDRPNGRFVYLLVFDHAFERKPSRPPLATLVWKDWRGEPVLQFPGLDGGQVSPPSGVPTLPEDARPPSEPSPPPPAAEPVVDVLSALMSAQEQVPAPEAEPGAGPVPAPTGRRRRSDDELISDLFEAMHELRFMPDVASGAEFLLATLSQVIPAEAVLIHVFDINTRHFVVVSAKSPTSESVLSYRTPDQDPFFAHVMRHVGALVLPDTASDPRFAGGRWDLCGAHPRSVLCGAVRQGGRYLGLVEIANPEGDTPFQQGEVYALDYVCEQFADFLASRPIVLATTVPPPKS